VTSLEALRRAESKVVGRSCVLKQALADALRLGEKCTVYIDRDPCAWPHIVQYLNTGKLTKICCVSELIQEARELGLEELGTLATQGNFIGWRPHSHVIINRLQRNERRDSIEGDDMLESRGQPDLQHSQSMQNMARLSSGTSSGGSSPLSSIASSASFTAAPRKQPPSAVNAQLAAAARASMMSRKMSQSMGNVGSRRLAMI